LDINASLVAIMTFFVPCSDIDHKAYKQTVNRQFLLKLQIDILLDLLNNLFNYSLSGCLFCSCWHGRI